MGHIFSVWISFSARRTGERTCQTACDSDEGTSDKLGRGTLDGLSGPLKVRAFFLRRSLLRHPLQKGGQRAR